MLACLGIGFVLLQTPRVVSIGTADALYERMGLQAIQTSQGIALLGGFSYRERECRRQISFIAPARRETQLSASLAVGRNHFQAFALDGDHALAIGGYSEAYGSLAEVEEVDFSKGTVEAWPWLKHESELFRAIRLGDKIAVIGGLITQGITKTWDDIQVIDLKTKEVVVSPGRLRQSRFGHDAVWLPMLRKVLIAGGQHVIEAKDAQSRPTYQALSSMEYWDPKTGEVTPAGEMTLPRDRPKLWVQEDGRVLIIGGASRDRKLDSIELFDPRTRTSKLVAHMSVARMAATVLPYKNRGLVIAGGWVDDPEMGRLIEYIDFATHTVQTIGSTASSRAEHAMMWIKPDEFVLAGGKDSFGSRNPHSYAFKTTEYFKILD